MSEGLLAGVLPEIYSRSNVFKRKLIDALRNPGGTLKNVAGNAYDKTMRAGQMLRESAAEGMERGPATDRLLDAMAESYNPSGITVWHGSPHRFTKFDSSKIGTGEGAQAYGHGLYLAESPDVAKGYQAATSKDRFITKDGFFEPSQLEHLNVKAKVRQGDLDAAIEAARIYARPDHDYPETAAKAARDLAKLEALKASGGIKPNLGVLYKVDLPDEAVAKMLDWDKPLSQQNEVRKALSGVSAAKYADKYFKANRKNDPTGADIHDFLRLTGLNPNQIAPAMREAGIPGIRYLDGDSRGTGTGTSNFVVFPGGEDMLQILEVNGQPVIDALRKKK